MGVGAAGSYKKVNVLFKITRLCSFSVLRDVQFGSVIRIERLGCRFFGMDFRPKVYVTRPDIAPVSIELLQKECDVTTWDSATPVPRSVLLSGIKGASGLFCTLSDKVDTEVLEAAGPGLKVICTMSVGYDHINIDKCKEKGIRIGYTPDVLTDATAELTVALLLATSRRLIEANKEVYNGGWKSWAPSWMCGPGLKDSTVGIVGFGQVGQQTARILKSFNPRKVLFSNRTPRPKEASDIGADQVAFNRLIKDSDFVICTIAYSAENEKMFNEEVFTQMKPTAVFVNTSRGALVDQSALYKALLNKTIWGAGLDVTTPEPLPLDDPLMTLSNCVILPHIGSATIDTRAMMAEITALNILAGLKGKKMIAEL